jgi:1-deoxy-D-xylulose-5-phosphate reductoisomerase
LRRLEFEPPDRATFRCLDLAYAAGRAGGTAPAWLSAANEVAVDAFLAGRLSWIDIPAVIAAALDVHDRPSVVDDVAVVLDADRRGREAASRVVAGIVGRRGHLVEPAAPTS